MPSIQDTSYPHFKKNIPETELEEFYTPAEDEFSFFKKETKSSSSRLYLLVLLKTFQRLGYFVSIKNIPVKIIDHIAEKLNMNAIPKLSPYDKLDTRTKHIKKIRSYLKIKLFDEKGKDLMKKTIIKISQTREDLVDIINVAIEELVHYRFELPAFSTLHRAALKGRSEANTELYKKIYDTLSKQMCRKIDRLFEVKSKDSTSPWQDIKSEPKKLGCKTVRERLEHFKRLSKHCVAIESLTAIPDIKIKQFSSEGNSLNAARMRELKKHKKYALAVSLITTRMSVLLDDFGEMFIRQNISMHNNSQQDLIEINEMNTERTDRLIGTLHKIMLTREDQKTVDDREKAVVEIVGGKEKEITEDCKKHMVYAGKNYFPFLPRHYLYQRKSLFDVLDIIKPQSTTQEESLISLIAPFPDKF